MNSTEKADVSIKSITAFILLLGFLFSIIKFQQEQQANREAEDERQKEAVKTKFLDKQLDLYLRVTEATGTIVSENDHNSKEYINAEKNSGNYIGGVFVLWRIKMFETP